LWQAAQAAVSERNDLTAAAAAESASLSHGDSLGLLLGVEGFLLAAITLAIALGAPDQTRQPLYVWLNAEMLRFGAVAVLVIVSLGAGAAWASLFVGGKYQGLAVAFEAGALLVAIVGQPVLALLLALAARRA